MKNLSLPPHFLIRSHMVLSGYCIEVVTAEAEALVCHCQVHELLGNDLVYPVCVMTLSPEHRQALPDLKLHLLDHLVQENKAIVLSAGNETTGGRFSWQTQLQYLIGRGYNAYKLAGTQISRFDDKALQAALDRPWNEPLPLVFVSRLELPLNAAYEIPVDYVHSLDALDARAVLEW